MRGHDQLQDAKTLQCQQILKTNLNFIDKQVQMLESYVKLAIRIKKVCMIQMAI